MLISAAGSGNETAVRFWLGPGCATVDQTDKNGFTALMAAARGGHAAVVRALLEQNAVVYATTKDGQTALMYAANSGSDEAVEELLRAGANIEAEKDDGYRFVGARGMGIGERSISRHSRSALHSENETHYGGNRWKTRVASGLHVGYKYCISSAGITSCFTGDGTSWTVRPGVRKGPG
eukprot:9350577-Pyramimonas_sp.AAC.3